MTDEKALRLASVSLVAGVVAIVGILMMTSFVNWKQGEDIRDILTLVDRELVDSWEVNALEGEYTIGGAPITLEGWFNCSREASEADPIVQFVSSIRPVAIGGYEVLRRANPARPISAACTDGFVPFEVAWTDALVAQLSVADLREVEVWEIRISVSASGWGKGEAVSTPFQLVRATD